MTLVARMEKRLALIPDNRALLRSEGLPRTLELLAISLNPPTQIMTRLPGIALSDWDIDGRPVISDEELKLAINVAIELGNRGILTDCKPGNLLCSKEGQLGFIDYVIGQNATPLVLIEVLFGHLTFIHDGNKMYRKYVDKARRLNEAQRNDGRDEDISDKSPVYKKEEDPEYLAEDGYQTLRNSMIRKENFLMLVSALKKDHAELVTPFLDRVRSEKYFNFDWYSEKARHFPTGKILLAQLEELHRKIVGVFEV